MADDAASSPPIAAADEDSVHNLAKASNPDRALIPASNGSVISRQGPTPIEPLKASAPKRKKGVKGPILL